MMKTKTIIEGTTMNKMDIIAINIAASITKMIISIRLVIRILI